MTILDFIVFVFILGVVSYFAWRSGFEEGQSAANRKHTQQWCRLRNENGILSKRTVDLYDRVDEIETRLRTAETKIKFTTNILYGRRVIVKGEMPDGAADCVVVQPEEQLKFVDEYMASDVDPTDLFDNAVKKQDEEVVAKEE